MNELELLVKEVEAVLDTVTRTCCKCGEDTGPQPLTAFHASEKYPKGAQYMCKRCCSRYVRRRREEVKKQRHSVGNFTRTLHGWLGISPTLREASSS